MPLSRLQNEQVMVSDARVMRNLRVSEMRPPMPFSIIPTSLAETLRNYELVDDPPTSAVPVILW